MKAKHTLILGSLFLISFSSFAQDKKVAKLSMVQSPDAKKPDGQPSEAEQQAWMAYMTPGSVHKMLAAADGEWHEVLTFWMAPGDPPTKAEADCVNKMILGGRYQESVNTGNMMGMPFEGRSLVGYDNVRKIMQSTWVDNMGTGIMTLEGKFDEKTNTATLTGKGVDAATGKVENVRQVMKFIDEKNQKMEMYMTKNGKEFKNMEIIFTKK
jgi:hypothetical protein